MKKKRQLNPKKDKKQIEALGNPPEKPIYLKTTDKADILWNYYRNNKDEFEKNGVVINES